MLEPVGEAEICDDNVTISVEEQIFELEITVDNLLLMDIPYSTDQLCKELSRVFFSEISVGEDMIEEFSTRGVVEDDTDVFVGFDCLVESDNVGMVQ